MYFTEANWYAPQTMTVRAIDDIVDEPPLHYTRNWAVAISSDPRYNNTGGSDYCENYDVVESNWNCENYRNCTKNWNCLSRTTLNIPNIEVNITDNDAARVKTPKPPVTVTAAGLFEDYPHPHHVHYLHYYYYRPDVRLGERKVQKERLPLTSSIRHEAYG